MSLLHALPTPLRRPAERLIAKNLQNWLVPWATYAAENSLHSARRDLRSDQPLRHLIFCFCDHYEPEWGRPTKAVAEARVAAWQKGYPRAFSAFRDADGRRPQHSFFFPGEEYRPAYLDRLTELVQAGYGEVELHLHHNQDTAQILRDKIATYLQHLGAHGHFSRMLGDPDDPGDQTDQREKIRYAFIHGDWALANAHGTGKACGVDDELLVLFDTGCYADYTFPSAPHSTQPRLVNQIYWPTGDLHAARSYEHGTPARVGQRLTDRLLLVQGPLAVSVPDARGRLLPRIEAAAITAADPPTPDRVRTWVKQGICIKGRPEWIFVKVHTHGAPETQAQALLGPPVQALHQTLSANYNDGLYWALHYVTARELYNIACAAMDGMVGDPAGFRDYCLPPPPARQGRGPNI